MSGPIAIEYVLVPALLDAAWGAYQAARQRRDDEAHRQQAAADERARERQARARLREDERRAREHARVRAEHAARLMQRAKDLEHRLAHARQLAEETCRRHRALGIEIPVTPSPPADTGDPGAVQRYLERIEAAIRQLNVTASEQAARAAGERGLAELVAVLSSVTGDEPRSAADLLRLYAEQVSASSHPAASGVTDRRATAERILDRLAGLSEGELPPQLDALMRKLIEAPTDDRAEMLALELRAQVQQFNEARARASAAEKEDRRREMAGVLVAEVLSDLGYDVEPIADTLFVSGGVAHFQRAEWGDYYVRMRVDPATANVNFNMVRAGTSTEPPDEVQRKRDQAMEASWCSGIPKLLAELRARGIDTRTLRELDAGAVPVQVVKPQTIDAVLRERSPPQTSVAPRALARPLNE